MSLRDKRLPQFPKGITVRARISSEGFSPCFENPERARAGGAEIVNFSFLVVDAAIGAFEVGDKIHREIQDRVTMSQLGKRFPVELAPNCLERFQNTSLD